MLNTYQLEDGDVQQLAALCVACGVDAVKTTCGDSVIPRATTARDVELLRAAVGDKAVVEAEGQIDTQEAALALLAAGADIIYTSSAFAIVDSAEE